MGVEKTSPVSFEAISSNNVFPLPADDEASGFDGGTEAATAAPPKPATTIPTTAGPNLRNEEMPASIARE
jgi:hypothetical protein